jgi:hypothetical protein
MFAPGLDVQLLAMSIVFGIGLFLILQFNINNKKKCYNLSSIFIAFVIYTLVVFIT